MQRQVWIVVKPDPGKPSLTGIGPLVDGSVVPGGCLGVLLRRYVSLGDLCGSLAAVAVAFCCGCGCGCGSRPTILPLALTH
jgi:hypothetical protein